jgi:small redox-active disulfide protein 2
MATKVTVYGPGCAKCTQLEAAARKAVSDLGLEAEVEKVSDIVRIAQAGILMTPALAVNGKVVLKGKAADAAEVANLITSELDGS